MALGLKQLQSTNTNNDEDTTIFTTTTLFLPAHRKRPICWKAPRTCQTTPDFCSTRHKCEKQSSRSGRSFPLCALSQSSRQPCWLAHALFGSPKELLFPNSSSTLFNNGVCSKACKLSLLVLKTVPSNSKQNKSLLFPTSKSLQRT